MANEPMDPKVMREVIAEGKQLLAKTKSAVGWTNCNNALIAWGHWRDKHTPALLHYALRGVEAEAEAEELERCPVCEHATSHEFVLCDPQGSYGDYFCENRMCRCTDVDRDKAMTERSESR